MTITWNCNYVNLLKTNVFKLVFQLLDNCFSLELFLLSLKYEIIHGRVSYWFFVLKWPKPWAIKNASKLIVVPGQGCLFVLEGDVEAFFEEEGIYELNTENIPI